MEKSDRHKIREKNLAQKQDSKEVILTAHLERYLTIR